ncbi:MAG: aldo/keto reductase [Elusimicrobiota bacterium]|jgi:predicted aldo/keto reductase-like oxidoreductase|nr:aldo/keto reductase [Elusimicrobiota bacterium]
MIYKNFKDLKISALAMGAMRLPKVDGVSEKIDKEKSFEIIDYAYKNGINYFDTAYRYHGGESETFLGEALSRYPRESFYLATKMPGHMMTYNKGKFEFSSLMAGLPAIPPDEIFKQQLQKCRVSYFDFYLLHNVCEGSLDFYTNKEIGVLDFLIKQKENGAIRHLGFSAHCRPETIETFLNWCGKNFAEGIIEFAQIQLNYLDWDLQNAKRKYEILTERKIPVWVMEPCRGGKLANFDGQTNALLKQVRPDDSIASWAFRYLKSLPNVCVILSGMSSLEQLKDNLKTFEDESVLSEKEKEVLNEAVKTLSGLIPCTSCRYCCEGCPKNLDIPRLIEMFNESSLNPNSILIKLTAETFKENELPSNCISCGACAKVCPQGIDIPNILKKLSDKITEIKASL